MMLPKDSREEKEWYFNLAMELKTRQGYKKADIFFFEQKSKSIKLNYEGIFFHKYQLFGQQQPTLWLGRVVSS